MSEVGQEAATERRRADQPDHAQLAPIGLDPALFDPARMDPAMALVQLTTLVQGIYSAASERHDLTPVQAKLLCVLLGGPRGMAELAQRFGVEKAALTGLMDRAERRGLAQRSAVPGDRRALQVTLTDAGRTAALAFYAEIRAELGKLIDPLEPAERERFRSTMTSIIGRCGSHGC